MRLRLRIATGALGMAGALAMLAAPVGVAAASPSPTAAPTVATTTVATTACTNGHWPASVQGVPKVFKAGARAGDYIWHDRNGWHLRVTHAGSRGVVFSGVIRSSAPLTATGVKLEKNDHFTVSADLKSISYRFVNYGHIDGIDFKTSCAKQLSFRGAMAGHLLPIGRIWVGARGLHPLQNPFIVRRVL
jgi:hypothetical protein